MPITRSKTGGGEGGPTVKAHAKDAKKENEILLRNMSENKHDVVVVVSATKIHEDLKKIIAELGITAGPASGGGKLKFGADLDHFRNENTDAFVCHYDPDYIGVPLPTKAEDKEGYVAAYEIDEKNEKSYYSTSHPVKPGHFYTIEGVPLKFGEFHPVAAVADMATYVGEMVNDKKDEMVIYSEATAHEVEEEIITYTVSLSLVQYIINFAQGVQILLSLAGEKGVQLKELDVKAKEADRLKAEAESKKAVAEAESRKAIAEAESRKAVAEAESKKAVAEAEKAKAEAKKDEKEREISVAFQESDDYVPVCKVQ